jgi:hypothetical protein
MTNQELKEEIVRSREMSEKRHLALEKEIKDLKKEFYLFKGKAFGFISILTTGIGFFIDYLKHK